ncbi:hypothetical protein V8C35DRAFT_282499 [Trichoderma chlorosporum]
MQLPPTVMTMEDKDAEGHHRNRLGQYGAMSALEGLFDTCHREVYNDVPFNYGTKSALANHPIDVSLENYLKGRIPKLAPAAAGKLREVFVHCEGTVCIVDEVTHSKRNPDQVANALDFLADRIKRARIDAADIAIITPYAANVRLLNRLRTRPEYEALSAMPPAATVDSFQDREGNIGKQRHLLKL